MSNRDYIYGLFYVKDDKKLYYYVGITKDHDRRSREHTQNKDMFYKRGSKDGSCKAGELKKGKYGEAAHLPEYVYYRQNILPHGYEEGFEVLETAVEGELEITEDSVMSRMIIEGHPLQNSKNGERWARWELLAKGGVTNKDQVKKFSEKNRAQLETTTERERRASSIEKCIKIMLEYGEVDFGFSHKDLDKMSLPDLIETAALLSKYKVTIKKKRDDERNKMTLALMELFTNYKKYEPRYSTFWLSDYLYLVKGIKTTRLGIKKDAPVDVQEAATRICNQVYTNKTKNPFKALIKKIVDGYSSYERFTSDLDIVCDTDNAIEQILKVGQETEQ